MPATVREVITARTQQYGQFVDQGALAQLLKDDVRRHLGGNNWFNLAPDQREAVDMILHKISRIVNGNPNHLDSWVDISGYATLIADRLSKAESSSKRR